ncbi:MAG TPA: ATP-binding protein [Polyangiaceae bacterium]|nr:ATP-binding protein [Polyangiaceae bacterium]
MHSPELSPIRLRALFALITQISSAETRPLDAALDVVLSATPAVAGAAFARGGKLVPAATRGFGNRSRGTTRALRALADRALANGAPTRLADVESDREGIEDARELKKVGGRTALALPLVGTRTPVGALVLVFRDESALDPDTIAFLDAVARVTGLASQHHLSTGDTERMPPSMAGELAQAAFTRESERIAHDLESPVGALVLEHEELAQAVEELCHGADPEDAALTACVSEVSRAAQRLGRSIEALQQRVLDLLSPERRESVPVEVDLAEITENAVALARAHLESRGVMLLERLERGALTRGRREGLSQVISSLVFHAADAAEGATTPRVWVSVTSGPESVTLTIDDNGATRPPRALAALFSEKRGTRRTPPESLRVRIASELVRAHDGTIAAEPRPGGGTRVVVTLPRSSELGARADSGPASARLRVLLVDDDPTFSRTIRRVLRPHEVRTAGTASEAELVLLDPTYVPDLVVCDVHLPGVNGNVLHERVAVQRPELAERFVFVTGGALGPEETDYLRASSRPTLFKPIDVSGLVDLLEQKVRTASERAAAG